MVSMQVDGVGITYTSMYIQCTFRSVLDGLIDLVRGYTTDDNRFPCWLASGSGGVKGEGKEREGSGI